MGVKAAIAGVAYEIAKHTKHHHDKTKIMKKN